MGLSPCRGNLVNSNKLSVVIVVSSTFFEPNFAITLFYLKTKIQNSIKTMQFSSCFHQFHVNNTTKLGFHHSIGVDTLFSNTTSSLKQSRKPLVTAQSYKSNNKRERVELRGKKENVWSIDNEKSASEKTQQQQRRRRGRRVVREKRNRGGGGVGRVLVSGSMLMEVETVLQTQVILLVPI